MGEWAVKINSKIDETLKDARDKDLRFLRIAEFKRNIERVDNFSNTCGYCSGQKDKIEQTAENIFTAVNEPGGIRRNYDRLISSLSKHMQKEHRFYAPYYFSYLYSFFGLIAGGILGFLLNMFFTGYTTEMYSIGITAGLIPAYFAGLAKDKKIRAANRLM